MEIVPEGCGLEHSLLKSEDAGLLCLGTSVFAGFLVCKNEVKKIRNAVYVVRVFKREKRVLVLHQPVKQLCAHRSGPQFRTR